MTVRKMTTIGSMLFLGAIAVPVMAQNNPGGGGGGGGTNNNGGGGGGGRGNFQQYRQQMMDQLKTMLGASDDEFTAMQPKIEKVFQLQRDSQGQGMRALYGNRGGRGGRGGNNNGGGGGNGGPGGGGPGGDQPATPMTTATAALKDTLDNKDSKPDDIKAKLDAFRAAKAQTKDEITKAQEDLKSVLTQRQEAVLVELGLLD